MNGRLVRWVQALHLLRRNLDDMLETPKVHGANHRSGIVNRMLRPAGSLNLVGMKQAVWVAAAFRVRQLSVGIGKTCQANALRDRFAGFIMPKIVIVDFVVN